MKKLIVKSQLLDRGTFERQIAGIGMEMSPVIWQHERVYLPSEWRPNMNYPRLVMRTEVRTTAQPAEYFMYLKRHIEDSGVDYVNFTRVGDYTEATGMIHQLGFRKTAEISRRRQEVWLDNRTVIYLDEVEGVAGPFLKIEAEMDENESVEALRTDLFTILSMFGQKTFTMKAYFELVRGEAQQFLLPAVG